MNGALVSVEATLEGPHPITIGAGCVVNPKAVIRARGGPITIGGSNVIEELAEIVNDGPGPLTVGDFNLFEVGARCEARIVGNMNVFEVRSRVGRHGKVGDGCVVGIRAEVVVRGGDGAEEGEGTDLGDGAVVYRLSGPERMQRRRQRMPTAAQEHKAVLKRYLAVLSDPKSGNYVGHFHHLMKAEEQ